MSDLHPLVRDFVLLTVAGIPFMVAAWIVDRLNRRRAHRERFAHLDWS